MFCSESERINSVVYGFLAFKLKIEPTAANIAPTQRYLGCRGIMDRPFFVEFITYTIAIRTVATNSPKNAVMKTLISLRFKVNFASTRLYF